MRVIAIKKGFYGASRRRPGDVFEMSEKHLKNGKPPSWCEEAGDEAGARKRIAEAQRAAANKHLDAAKAASGGAAARKKVIDDTLV